MNEVNNKNKSFYWYLKNRLLIISISAIFILAAIVFTVWSVSAPIKKVKNFNETYGTNSDGKPCYDHPSLQNAVKETSYLTAFNTLAKNDSIGLIVNLSDSLISLVLKGVIIHNAQIMSFSTDGFFKALDICAYQNLFASPIEISSQDASIEKEPVVIKKAPKSEEEASTAPYFPDTLKNKRIADIELKIAVGFNIYIHDGTDGCDKANENVSTPGETWKNIKRLLIFRKPEYEPSIHICIQKNDALSIYRALPAKALLIMKI